MVIRVPCDTQPDMGLLLVDKNLGKREVTLNLKTDVCRKALSELFLNAEVILESCTGLASTRNTFSGLQGGVGKELCISVGNRYGCKGLFAH